MTTASAGQQVNLTLRHYEAERRRQCLAEYDGVTSREYDQSYPPGARLAEWVDAVLASIAAGARLSRTVADDIARRAPHAYRHIARAHSIGRLPNALPAGYLPPDVRAVNAAREAENRAARRATQS